jgi:serine/threonine protein kinase
MCSGGHLGEVIADTPYGRLDERHAQRYVCQLIGAIQHCHNHGICHRDVKLQNILLETRSSDAQIKLIDFGNAKRFSTINNGVERHPFRTITGTTYAMAPEVQDMCVCVCVCVDMTYVNVYILNSSSLFLKSL